MSRNSGRCLKHVGIEMFLVTILGTVSLSWATSPSLTDRRDYDIEHYLRILRDSYAERPRVVFEAEDFSQLFRLDAQQGLFDRPIEQMQLRWIRCQLPKAKE
jgi:hypothetical protein